MQFHSTAMEIGKKNWNENQTAIARQPEKCAAEYCRLPQWIVNINTILGNCICEKALSVLFCFGLQIFVSCSGWGRWVTFNLLLNVLFQTLFGSLSGIWLYHPPLGKIGNGRKWFDLEALCESRFRIAIHSRRHHNSRGNSRHSNGGYNGGAHP